MSKNNLSFYPDTIAAQATPPGRGGVAIIRISGSQVKKIIRNILGKTLVARTACYLPFYDENNLTIDIGIAIFFPCPHSFTGEDVLELHAHGGPVIVDLLLQRLLNLGARLARPGEFSERAFLNNKMDLTQAEAIADLIDASCEKAARLAMRSLQGDFAKTIKELNEKIIYLRMYIESAIDFTEEEIDFLADKKIQEEFEILIKNVTFIQTQAKQGHFLREGITAVIAGKPNVGKSSLLNCLSGKEIAIVTDIPGTTRDVLRDYILIDGMPMHIIDTAGLRDSMDVVEQEGIRRAYDEIEKADIILYMLDATEGSEQDLQALPEALRKRPLIFIYNKIDLINVPPSINRLVDQTAIYLSAKSGQGVALLKNHIKARVGFDSNTEGIFLARRRHLDALAKAKTHLTNGLEQLLSTKSGELVADDLRLAQRALNEMIGEFTSDDLLGRIFANFCIGK